MHVWVFNLDKCFERWQAVRAKNVAWIILCSQLGSGKPWRLQSHYGAPSVDHARIRIIHSLISACLCRSLTQGADWVGLPFQVYLRVSISCSIGCFGSDWLPQKLYWGGRLPKKKYRSNRMPIVHALRWLDHSMKGDDDNKRDSRIRAQQWLRISRGAKEEAMMGKGVRQLD
jgi:hypothetical protein